MSRPGCSRRASTARPSRCARFVRCPGAGRRRGPPYAAIFRTSGTTGAAKRVPVTHQNLIEMARQMERWMELTPSDRAACIMPIHYNAGFKATLLCPLMVGCSVAFSESSLPKDFAREVVLRPTWLTAAPAWLQSLVDVGSRTRTR